MREILFRGKRLDNGEWAESPCNLGTMCSGTVLHDFDPKTVGQYTGITDRSGTRIFEGDVLEIIGDAAECIFKSDLRFSVEYKTTSENACGYFLPDCIEYEVIGNIHDNPELLEEG